MRALLVGFDDEDALKRALDRLAAENLGSVETYTPKPLDEEVDPSGSPLPLVMFIAGLLGFVGFMLLMTYADVRAYPLDIGGRPNFAWPAFVPIAFELGVLCAMAAGFFGFFYLCRMPKLYEPVDDCDSLVEASRDGWFLALKCYDAERVRASRALLASLGPQSLEEFEA